MLNLGVWISGLWVQHSEREGWSKSQPHDSTSWALWF